MFTLARPGRVVVTIREVFPVCRIVGAFSVRGHAGVNRVVFKGRLRGRALPAGTYDLILGATRGTTGPSVRLVLVAKGVPTAALLAAARTSNACSAMNAFAASSLGTTLASGGTKSAETTRVGQDQVLAPSPAPPPATGGLALSPTAAAKKLSNPLVIFALGVAIALLALAALPQRAVPDSRLTYLLARHRVEVALAGTGALAAAVVALVLG